MEKKSDILKKSRGKYVIGYDINDEYVQISYVFLEEGEPETISTVNGTQQYQIPSVLFKRKDTGQWLYGKEALRAEQEAEGHLLSNLLSRAKSGEMISIGEEEFEPTALLTLFIRRSLSLLFTAGLPEKISGMMFTLDELDQEAVEVFSRVAANLQLKTQEIYFQSHVESFYYFMLNQPGELWYSSVLLFDYDNHRMKVYDFCCNQRTTPIVVLIDIAAYGEMKRKGTGAVEARRLDQEFLSIAQQHLKGRTVSTVYLIGDGYKDEFAEESVRYLLKARRGFRGNNLFGKGACYGMKERLGAGTVGTDYVFLGLDKLKANVGMRVLRCGQVSYFALMDAGINWFDARAAFDLILESGESISVVITPVDGKEPREVHMILEGLVERPPLTTRLHVESRMEAENLLEISVADKGFGELFAASGAKWTKLIEI